MGSFPTRQVEPSILLALDLWRDRLNWCTNRKKSTSRIEGG